MGTLKNKWGPNGDPKFEKGPHGDPGPQMGTHVGAVNFFITVLKCETLTTRSGVSVESGGEASMVSTSGIL